MCETMIPFDATFIPEPDVISVIPPTPLEVKYAHLFVKSQQTGHSFVWELAKKCEAYPEQEEALLDYLLELCNTNNVTHLQHLALFGGISIALEVAV